MKIHRHTPVLAFAVFSLLLVVILAQCLYLIKIEGMYQKREKHAQKRSNKPETEIYQDQCGYYLYVDGKFFDYKTY